MLSLPAFPACTANKSQISGQPASAPKLDAELRSLLLHTYSWIKGGKPIPDPRRSSCAILHAPAGEAQPCTPLFPATLHPSPPEALGGVGGREPCPIPATHPKGHSICPEPTRTQKLFFLLSLNPSFSKFNSEQPAAFSLTGLLWLIICVRIN